MPYFEDLYTIVHADIQKDLMAFINDRAGFTDIFSDIPFVNLRFNTSIEQSKGPKYNLYKGELGLGIIVKIYFDNDSNSYIVESSNYDDDKIIASINSTSWTEIKQYAFEMFNDDINLSVYTQM
jgi:hypothetical protein